MTQRICLFFKKTLTLIFFLVVALILAISLRGRIGNPTAEMLNSPYWKDQGPLELSPDRGRFALTYSMIEDQSLYFSLPLARFIAPDLGYKNGHYVSLFAPGVSFLIIPGYIIGKVFDLSQVGSFAIIALFGLSNAFLVKKISEKIGGSGVASNLAAIAFLFGTPAFTYAVTLYQHHISTFLFLLSVYLLIKFKGLVPLLAVWLLLASSAVIDYPNVVFAIPIALYALTRMISLEKVKELSVKINFKLAGVLTFITIILPLGLLLYFNQLSYQNPLQLSGTISSVKAIDSDGRPTIPSQSGIDLADQFTNPDIQQRSAISFFQTRFILHGFFIHIFSPDRGIVVYAPVILFGIWGIFLLYKKNPTLAGLFAAIILSNLLLYSMWDDPWGGWAFGSRYLIISYAFLAIGIAYLLTIIGKKYIVVGIFGLVFTYSVLVNTLGAITSSKNPPQEEVLQLESQTHKEEKYTFARNSVYLLEYGSKSFVYQTYLTKLISPIQFYLALSALIILLALSQLTLLQMVTTTEEKYQAIKVLKRRTYVTA